MKSPTSSRPNRRRSSPATFEALVKLTSRDYRDESGLYFVEGFRFAHEALQNPGQIVAVGWCPSLARPHAEEALGGRLAHLPQFKLTESQIGSLGFSPEPQGIVLVLEQRILSLEDCVPSRAGLWLGFEAIHSSGNLGTILRSMAASGAAGLFLFSNRGQLADPFDPQVVRASMGAQLNMPIIRTTYRDLARWTYRSEVRVLGAMRKERWTIEKCRIDARFY